MLSGQRNGDEEPRVGGVWNREQIQEWRANDYTEFQKRINELPGLLLIENYNPGCVEPGSYDLTVGQFIQRLASPHAKSRDVPKLPEDVELTRKLIENGSIVDLIASNGYEIRPGEAVVIWTQERVALPNTVTALVTTKINLAWEGLLQVTSRIDPGFGSTDGARHLQIPLFNAGNRSIKLRLGTKFANLVFINLQGPTKPYQTGKVPGLESRPYKTPENLAGLDLDELIARLSGRDESMDVVAAALEKLRTSMGAGGMNGRSQVQQNLREKSP